MKNIAFIINPIAGTQQNKRKLPKLIQQTLDPAQWLADIVFTEHAGHACELAKQFARMGFDAVVAVGGDGTVNEVANGLRGTKTALGIIPMGSGNGLARHLNIPLRTPRALEMINHAEPISIDYGIANGRFFVSTCGAGFDAVVADQFAGSSKRGFMTYLEKTLQQAWSYNPETYRLTIDGEQVEQSAFLITFANANQWGYEALIAPKASVQDGQMDICIMSSHALAASASLAVRLFAGTIDESHFMTTLRGKHVHVERQKAGPFHLDGDPVEMEKDIDIQIIADGLRVLVEKRF